MNEDKARAKKIEKLLTKIGKANAQVYNLSSDLEIYEPRGRRIRGLSVQIGDTLTEIETARLIQ